jgi:hypothetical protein
MMGILLSVKGAKEREGDLQAGACHYTDSRIAKHDRAPSTFLHVPSRMLLGGEE